MQSIKHSNLSTALVKLVNQQGSNGERHSPMNITNVVKQGGLLSPILFGMYMDVLFEALSTSQAGCRVGQQFMGAFGYADDVILIAPTKRSMNALFYICTDFSRDFQIKFNPHKSKLIAYPKSNSDHDLSITFDGQRVYAKSHYIHLGHIIGDNVSELTITGARNEFIKKVNVHISYLYIFIWKRFMGFFVQLCQCI